MKRFFCTVLTTAMLATLSTAAHAGSDPLTWTDLMQFRQIRTPVLSEDGQWVAYALDPDRGDGEAVVQQTRGGRKIVVPRGVAPTLSPDGTFAAMKLELSVANQEKDEDDRPKPGMALVSTSTGDVLQFDRVDNHVMSEDGNWLAYHLHAAEEDENEADEADEATSNENSDEDEDESERPEKGTLVVRHLPSGNETSVPAAHSYMFDETSAYLAVSIADKTGDANALIIYDLKRELAPTTIHAGPNRSYQQLSWANDSPRLAFLTAMEDEPEMLTDLQFVFWDGEARTPEVPDDFTLSEHGSLVWSENNDRVFLGLAAFSPEEDDDETKEVHTDQAETDTVETPTEDDQETEEPFDPYDTDELLGETTRALWHSDDGVIRPNAEKRWKDYKNRTHRAVFHFDKGFVRLADAQMHEVRAPRYGDFTLGTDEDRYEQERTWEGYFEDIYIVDVRDGTRSLVTERLGGSVTISPNGRFVVYFQGGQWHLYDVGAKTTRSLTQGLGVPFANEDWDYPAEIEGYGVGGWIEDDAAVLLYDKYDVWQFPTTGGAPICLTDGHGRRENQRMRVIDLDREIPWYGAEEPLLIESYDHDVKTEAFYSARAGQAGVRERHSAEKLFNVIGKAEEADVVLYTREDFAEFPNLWVADSTMGKRRQVSDANPQMEDFAYGEPVLVDWSNLDGEPMQGALFLPGNYEKGKRYPVLVYYYRSFSQRLHEFNEPVINHRPSFPMYTSNGYCVFLPDIRFDVGEPGPSTVRSLVPGVQKIVDLGYADPEAIGLHGHSWSGYSSAYVITQTDIFAACVSGAPVVNMTSAYSGIRWGTGLARQFQYEKWQSRIGGSLWEYPERYIENSPLFFADRINTPLLIQHGDVDEAVPWYQSIEFYLAMRRLGKPCVFLQYKDEPHHLKKYPNKLDYSIKMMEFFDHHLKGAPAPEWLINGEPYRGD